MLTAAQARANADQALDWHEQPFFDELMRIIEVKSKEKNYQHYFPDNKSFTKSIRAKLSAAGYVVTLSGYNWKIEW